MNELLKRMPKEAIAYVCGGACLLVVAMTGILIKRADAQISINTTNIGEVQKKADEALVKAEQVQLQYSELRGTIQTMSNSNETFRKEYREDTNKIRDLLLELSRK